MSKSLVVPSVVDLGSCPAGGSTQITVQVANNAARPIRVVHSTTDCSCVSITRLPLRLDGGSVGSIEIRLDLRRMTAGPFQKRIEFWYSADSGATMAMVGTTVIGRAE